VHSIQIC